LKGWDYNNYGFYFVTVCTQKRECLFGKIKNRKMELNDIGLMVNSWWQKIPNKFPGILLDEYQIMPNHMHGIVNIDGSTYRSTPTGLQTKFDSTYVGADPCVRPIHDPCVRPQQKLFQIIRWFKTMCTNQYLQNIKSKNWLRIDKRLSQRNFYEHIICNENEYFAIRQYIQNNPQNWESDRNNLDL